MQNKIKFFFMLLSLLLIATSCASKKYLMSDEEIAAKGYSIRNWDVVRNDTVVGHLTSTEWELYRNHLTREISISTGFSSDSEMQEILRFVHTKFPNDKIEINEDDGNSFPKN